jgi:CheY-like chemotaxis protein
MTKSIAPKNIVVYADDDPDDLDLVQDAFAQYSKNVEVLTFMDGSQVLSYLERLSNYDPSPCLIILDINMPIINGKEALIRIREMNRYKSVPVVLFTTSSLPMDESFASRYHAGFVTKPIEAKQMEIITDQFINHCSEEIQRNIRREVK